MRLEIKLGHEKDIPIAYHLMLEAFEEYRFLEVPSSAISEKIATVEKAFSNNNVKFILCIVDDIPLGSLSFKIKENMMYFSRVSVSPKARGKGLAKAMLVWIEYYAKSEGLIKLECRVRQSLSSNIRLYESIGYKIAKEENVLNPSGLLVHTVLMEKLI